jgi:hypothetical protein
VRSSEAGWPACIWSGGKDLCRDAREGGEVTRSREKREKREEQRGRLAGVHLVRWLWSTKRVCCTLVCDSCVLAGGNREEPPCVNVVSEGIGLWGRWWLDWALGRFGWALLRWWTEQV